MGVKFAFPSSMQQISKLPTEPFRREHAVMKLELEEIAERIGELAELHPAVQDAAMARVVAFFKHRIVTHAEWEERMLYPEVDKLAAKGAHRFTATMRYEQRIARRWIGELEREATQSTPDVKAFARRADNLLGLIQAHFEQKEQVLLPILDSKMTPAQFERRIMQKAEPPAEGTGLPAHS